MRRLLALVIASGLALLGLVSTGGSATAVVPGTNGRVAFARCVAPFKCFESTVPVWEIVAADPDDINETVLAGPYTRDAFDDHFIANWAPDGSSVIFMLNNEIWQVNADGTDLHRVFKPPARTGVDDGPTFTPDGEHIVFTRCCPKGFGYSLWMINADGTGLTDVTKEPVVNGDGPADTDPEVSPNGKQIVFNRCFPDQPCVIATVHIDGTHLRQLTDNSVFEGTQPEWSPDSRKIVFQAHYFGGGADIVIMNRDGTDATQLTFGGPEGRSGNFDPCFSPDGTKILFDHFLSTGGNDLFTMNPDGSSVTQVTRDAPLEFSPEWAVG